MAVVAQMDRDESYLARCGTRWPQSTPRGVVLCVDPPVRARSTPPATGRSSQLAASAESLLTDAESSDRRFNCTSDALMLRLGVMLKVPSQSSVRS